jgi:hypothetical protein
VSRPDPDLQDYLDDRMDAEQQRAFRRRLEREPDLAERLAEHRRLRDALREDEPLPPGFYTRTRAEFERRHGSRKRRGLRVLSWEAAGLATAAVLALALFVPGLIREELPGTPSVTGAGRAVRQDSAAEPGTSADADSPPAAEPEPAGVEESLGQQAGARSGLSTEERAKKEKAQPRQQLDADRFDAADNEAPGGKAAASRGATTTGETQRKGMFAPAPLPGPRAQAPPPARSTSPEPRELEDEAKARRRSRVLPDRPLRDEDRAIRAAPLRAGAVPRLSIRSVGLADARALLAAPEEPPADLSKAAGTEGFARADQAAPADERAVLIGPRDAPFSCDGVRVGTSTDVHFVILGRVGPGRPAAVGGCAVYLPADGRSVVIVDPPSEPR